MYQESKPVVRCIKKANLLYDVSRKLTCSSFMKYKLRQDGVKEVSFHLQLFWFSYRLICILVRPCTNTFLYLRSFIIRFSPYWRKVWSFVRRNTGMELNGRQLSLLRMHTCLCLCCELPHHHYAFSYACAYVLVKTRLKANFEHP